MHIDDQAIATVSRIFQSFVPAGSTVLDLMSSWVSHFPADFRPGRAAGLGMNAAELDANPALTERATQDLNRAPTLPYSDASFDVVTIAVSVQYLTQPVAVFGEIQRVLRPGGICAVSFSNRCFPTKAVALWSAMNDAGHAQIVEAYFTQAGGFDAAESLRLPTDVGADPMFVVQARRPAP